MTTLQDSIHAPHAQERSHIQEAFSTSAELLKRARRFDDCAFHGRLYLEGEPPEARLWIHRCGDRLCPLCAKYRAHKVSEQLKKLMIQNSVVRHITLTVKNIETGKLNDGLLELRASFARLRKTEQWKEKVTGGAYVLEITRNQKTGTWHPHIHILAVGFYFPHRLLSALWLDATNDSSIVWVTGAQGKHAKYLAKYCAKPPHLETWSTKTIVEYALATHGTRMVQTFGSLHGFKLEDSDDRAEPAATRRCISLSSLRDAARHGHPGAVALTRAAAMKWPSLWQFLRTAVDLPPPARTRELHLTQERLTEDVNHASKYILALSQPVKSK